MRSVQSHSIGQNLNLCFLRKIIDALTLKSKVLLIRAPTVASLNCYAKGNQDDIFHCFFSLFSLQKFKSLICWKILQLNRVFIFRANNDLYLDSYNYDIYTFPGSISTRWTTNLAPLERVITIQNNLSLWSLSDTLCYHLKDGFSLGIMQDDINVLTSPYSRHITYVDYSFPAVLCVETVIIVLYFLRCQCRAYDWRECVFWTFFLIEACVFEFDVIVGSDIKYKGLTWVQINIDLITPFRDVDTLSPSKNVTKFTITQITLVLQISVKLNTLSFNFYYQNCLRNCGPSATKIGSFWTSKLGNQGTAAGYQPWKLALSSCWSQSEIDLNLFLKFRVCLCWRKSREIHS